MKNHFRIEGDSVYILVRRKQEYFNAIIDVADFDLVSRFSGKWSAIRLRNKIYVRGAVRDRFVPSKNSTIYLHRVLLRARPNDSVRHRDGNGLNNRRLNLARLGIRE